jgi:hypothetical protein
MEEKSPRAAGYFACNLQTAQQAHFDSQVSSGQGTSPLARLCCQTVNYPGLGDAQALSKRASIRGKGIP